MRTVNPDVAWVEGHERVVLVDLTHPGSAEPMICPEPAASLWRALAAGPMPDRDLLTVAESKVGICDAPGLVDAFIRAFVERGWLGGGQ